MSSKFFENSSQISLARNQSDAREKLVTKMLPSKKNFE